jgi:tetratricopeptide (TPR) repeat protein
VLEQVQELTEKELNVPVEALNDRPLWRVIAASNFLHTIIHIAQSLIDRGERERAMRINDQSIGLGMKIDDSPGWQGLFLYNTGCYLALIGEKQRALESLEKGLRLNPQLVDYSKQDTDLVSLHNDASFLDMLERVAVTEQN